MKFFSVAGLAGACLLIAAPAFAAVAVSAEIAQAHSHATFAAKAGTIDAVHMHMHHSLNCLVGPKGDGFDASQMNPCANAGNGAITDETDAAKKAKLESAKADLMKGLAETDLKTAQATANSAAMTIASVQ
jgi:hypothetical protein